ncbi:MAG: hypothetical protein LBT93_07225, partial [Treponema sp.]|nr:hypothetical protein [Treponema sp.]
MASEKKPSIYYDRSTIGSSDELDEYGVWVKSEPQELFLENEDPSLPGMGGISDIDIGESFMDTAGDDSFSEDNPLEVSPIENTKEDSGFTEDMDFPDFAADSFEEDAFTEARIGETNFDFSDLPEPEESAFSEGTDTDAAFDFTEISPDNLLDNIPKEEEFPREEAADLKKVQVSPAETGSIPAEKSTGGKDSPAPDLSTQLLMKIAEELSSIRIELSNLKQEFRVLRAEDSGEGTGESQGHGFFDEEDDEKISLTGDELDTILHTTDFTEESGKEDSADLSVPEEEKGPALESFSAPAEPDDFVFEDEKTSGDSEDDIVIDL